MLPGSLVSSYDLYKHDTAIISSWLVHTARRNGYAASLLPGPIARSARLKGKARKQMREQSAKVGKTVIGGVKKTGGGGHKHRYDYVLPINVFVPLARFIAAVKKPKPVEIPPTITTTLYRVIRVRKSFATILKNKQGQPNKNAAVKHSYLVGVLEQVRDILKPLVGPLDLTDIREAVPQTYANAFSVLKVYSTPEGFHDALDADVPMPDHTPEPEDSQEDAYFAFSALFQDCRALRERVKGLWKEYKDSAIHLSAVSVAANTAIYLVRQMEEDVTPLVNKHGGFLLWSHIYYAASCTAAGENCNKREQPGDDTNLATYDLADHCMINVWLSLDAFRRAHKPDSFQAYNGQYGEYDPSLDASQLSNRQKYQQDKTALLEILGDISLVMTFKANPCEDELIRGVRHMLETDTVPFWVAFASQIYLDTLRCLQGPGSHHLLPFEEMRAWNTTVAESITATLSFHRRKKLQVRNWPPANDARLKQAAGGCGFWADDPVGCYKQTHGMPVKPHLFLRRHAIFCGLWVAHVRRVFHDAGITLTQAWGETIYMGHLYHAIRRHQGIEMFRWDDMELLMNLQGTESFFVNGFPGNAESDFKNYCLCMGYSEANWEPPSRQRQWGRPTIFTSKDGPRTLKTQAGVSMRLIQLLGGGVDGGVDGGMTPDDVKLVLTASHWAQAAEGNRVAMEKDLSAATTGGKGKEEEKRKAEPDGNEEVTPSKWVHKLALALQAEVAELAFDYFSMHVTCWTMLGAIRRVVYRKMRQIYAHDYLDDTSQLPFLVGLIFMAARKKTRSGADPLALMRMAARPMRQVIRRQGHRIQDDLVKSGIVYVPEDEDEVEDVDEDDEDVVEGDE